jgi:hypothetical protein
MKNTKCFMAGMLAILLAFGLVLAGCSTDPEEPTPAEKNLAALIAAGDFTIPVSSTDLGVKITTDKVTLTVGEVVKSYSYTISDTAIILKGAAAQGRDATIGYKINDNKTLTITGGLDQIADFSLASGPATSGVIEKLTPPTTPTPTPTTPTTPTTTNYTLQWGYLVGVSYSDIRSSSLGDLLTPAGSNAGYITGSNATAVYEQAASGVFDGTGTEEGSFSTVLDFSQQGIGLPSDLKAALRAREENVPLAAFFSVEYQGTDIAVLFYITKN